jgi:hypothetical protein
MATIRDEIIERTEAGEFHRRFREYCLAWKRFRTPRAFASVVRHAVEDGRGDDLYEVILDEDFRSERQAKFGINALRTDLHIARNFFSEGQPDLLRYMQVTFLEQTASDDPEIILGHRLHCQGFSDFLQLDWLPGERLDIGLQRALRRFFQASYDPATDPYEWDPEKPSVTIRLLAYEVGTWSCRCGRTTGFYNRYNFTCPCGITHGNGRVTTDTPACAKCRNTPEYVACPDCGTRVTLDILWQARIPGAHPSIYRVPVTVDVAVERAPQDGETVRFTLMHIPVPLGLKEREGGIVFELPDMLWLSEYSDGFADGSTLSVSDLPRYDRQTEICKILEAAFRRTLLGYRGSYRSFGHYLAKVLGYRRGYVNDLIEVAAKYTRGFERRIGANLGTPGRDSDLLRFLQISADVSVAVSPLLRDRAVILNRRLVDGQVLSAPHLLHLETRLDSDDVITPAPPWVAAELTSGLDEWGIVPLGAHVEPGQVLVGIAFHPPEDEMSPEERLLRAIYEDKEKVARNRSLVMTGRRSGRVVAEHLKLGWAVGREIPPAPGRFVEQTGPWDSHVRITIAVDQPVEVGDILIGEADAMAVVCGIAGGAALQKAANAAFEPDLVVAPGHPWAPTDSQQLRTVRVRLNHRKLVGQIATSRATGPYSRFSKQPVPAGIDRPQSLVAQDFRWLIAHGARHLAFELYGPRCDCIEPRLALHESLLLSDDRNLKLPCSNPEEWSSLHDSPSYAVRSWDRLLRSACIKPMLTAKTITLEPITDDELLANSHGEVKGDKTLNYLTLKPEKEGLFCERIFGPVRDWVCYCGKYRGAKFEGIICERCGVEITRASARCERFGHIELSAPVVHPWYLRGNNATRLAAMLRISEQELLRVASYAIFLVLHAGQAPTHAPKLLDSADWETIQESNPGIMAKAVTGGEAIEILTQRALTSDSAMQALRGVVMRRLPVLPSELRPMIRMKDGRFLSSDLNALYQKVIQSSVRLRRLTQIRASQETILGERALLQHNVNALFDNEVQENPLRSQVNRKFMSISGELTRLRHDFENRFVDYSALTSLVAGDTPAIDSALLPSNLAWNLFKPMVMYKLVETGATQNIKAAKRMVDDHAADAVHALSDVCGETMILISLPSGPWPFIAMRTTLTRELALQFQPALFDRIGWGLLGEHVKIFSILTREAAREARNILTPSQLMTVNVSGHSESSDHDDAKESVFLRTCENLTNRIAFATPEAEQSLFLTTYDYLALQNMQWLTGHHNPSFIA